MQGGVNVFLLSTSTALSIILAAAAVISLNPDDRISIKRGLLLTGLGFVFFLSTFELINHVALLYGQGFRHKYKLSWGHVLDISNKLVSAVQAALSCVTGAIVCSWSCQRDIVSTSHFMSEAYAWFGTAYFFYDIWSMYKVHIHMTAEKRELKETKDSNGSKGASADMDSSFMAYCRNEPLILFHHLFIGGFGFSVIVYLRGGLGDCVFGFVYLMELSTPFVSLRGILSKLGMKSTGAYVYNGLLMLLSFFVCRILSLPYVLLLYSRAVHMTYVEAVSSLPLGCKVSICILLLPQIYWFYLMSAGAIKVFFPRGNNVPDNKKKS